MPTLKAYIESQRTRIELDALADMQEELREIGKRTLAEIDSQPDDHQHDVASKACHTIPVAYDSYRHWELVDTSHD